MAVEASYRRNPFPVQLQAANRRLMNPIEGNANIDNTQMGYVVPLSGTAATTETMLPASYSAVKPTIKLESTIGYNNIPLLRKRPRDNPFINADYMLQIHRLQLDINRLVSQHMEKVKVGIEESWQTRLRGIMEIVDGGYMKKMKAKEEEIEKIGKLNWELEEQVKSLAMENQIWKDLAQTNEATANHLRSNLEQVFRALKVREDMLSSESEGEPEDAAAEIYDAQSCCGSNSEEELRWSNLCRNCGKEEASVLLLPCRHLCLCTVCGSSLHVCPLCKASKNASVRVNKS